MATLVFFHAHPDDESIATAGTMARASAEGHRVVLVLATRGEHGEVVPGVLKDGEQLGVRRTRETYEAAAILGAHRVEFLGYLDSGMMGEPENGAPGSFWSADVDHAAHLLAAVLTEEQADVLTVYDEIGGYGHPDHIQVHRVGHRAAQLAGVPRLFEATLNRDHIARMLDAAPEEVRTAIEERRGPDEEPESFGMPENVITHAVDVLEFIDAKLASMRAHASQIGDDHFFLMMSRDVFAIAMGTEWYIEAGNPRTKDEPFRPSLWD